VQDELCVAGSSCVWLHELFTPPGMSAYFYYKREYCTALLSLCGLTDPTVSFLLCQLLEITSIESNQFQGNLSNVHARKSHCRACQVVADKLCIGKFQCVLTGLGEA
jgi:hypothetical protein